jgi:adenylate cyclase, class 2
VTEVEIKLAIQDAGRGRALLIEHGFTQRVARVFEANTLYDTAGLDLRARRQILRLRLVGGAAILTFKGPPEAGPHKSREELEFTAGSGEVAAALLERLGYQPVFRYEKYRAEFARAGEPGHVTLDETPIGTYFELEGPPAWIDETASRLGFRAEQYITDSYGRLYFQFCEQRGLTPHDMVFTLR